MTVNIDAASVANFVLIILAWIYSNKRIDDVSGSLNKRIDDLKSIILAEAAATRAEIRADREVLKEKITNLR